MFYRHGLCIVTLALLFIYFKSHNQSNNETKVQISQEPHLKVPILEIRTTPNCAEIKNWNYSEDEKLYILLLSQRKELNHAQIIQIISTNEESSHSLITTSNSSSAICGLSHNKTYFLYSFVESSIAGGKSSIELQAIHTKSLETIWKPLLPSSNTFFTILFPALSLCFVFLYCLYGRIKSEKSCLINHYNNPADKIIKEWKLDLPNDSSKIKFKTTFTKEELPNGTDIKGINTKFEEENKEFEDERMCGLCCERPREAVFIDCGHIYSCMKCAMGLTQCPLDKKSIKYFLKFQINDWRGKKQTFLPQIKNNYIDNSNMTISSSYLNSIKNQLDLSEQYTLLKEENVLYQKFYKCLICNKRKKDVMFADCCHLVCCNECSFGFRKCPIDNIEITKRYTIYFA